MPNAAKEVHSNIFLKVSMTTLRWAISWHKETAVIVTVARIDVCVRALFSAFIA